MRWLGALFLALFTVSAAFAVNPDEILDDPALEARARAISAELRCLVCQNQSIDDSDAELARDLRVIVRERLVAGDSDAEVVDHVVARYGEFVLLRPVIAPHTIILWVAGPALLIGGIATLIVLARRRTRAGTGEAELSAEEIAALRRLEAGNEPGGQA